MLKTLDSYTAMTSETEDGLFSGPDVCVFSGLDCLHGLKDPIYVSLFVLVLVFLCIRDKFFIT